MPEIYRRPLNIVAYAIAQRSSEISFICYMFHIKSRNGNGKGKMTRKDPKAGRRGIEIQKAITQAART